jgi:hypothetical protein
MSVWVNSAIAAGAVLAGSGLTAFVTSRPAKRHAVGQGRSELVAALQAYGYAVTDLGLEIGSCRLLLRGRRRPRCRRPRRARRCSCAQDDQGAATSLEPDVGQRDADLLVALPDRRHRRPRRCMRAG